MHILITDDMVTNRLQIGLVLKNMGFTYDQAANGDQAIELILKNDYDLVLMDIEMPVRNGVETVRYIREHLQGMKSGLVIIAITVHDHGNFSDDIYKMGFNGLIRKPVTLDKLNKVIKENNLH